MKKYLPQLAAGLFLCSLVALIVISSSDLPYMVDGSLGPRFMPLNLAVVMAVLVLLYWLEACRPRTGRGHIVKLPTLDELKRPAGYVGLAVLLILLWERLGAVPTVLLVSALEMRWLEESSWKKAAGISLFLAAFTWGLFALVLDINLPTGIFKNLIN